MIRRKLMLSALVLGFSLSFLVEPARGGTPRKPASGAPVVYTLQVLRVTAIDDLEGRFRGDPDFKVLVYMGRTKKFWSSKKSGKTIRPNWTFRHESADRELYISMSLWEDDFPGEDEFCDIHPRKGEKILQFRVPRTGTRILGDAQQLNKVYILRGNGEPNRCEIMFRITRTGG